MQKDNLENETKQLNIHRVTRSNLFKGMCVQDSEGKNTTELFDSPYSSVISQYMITKCCNTHVCHNHNFCPNCGRKIVR